MSIRSEKYTSITGNHFIRRNNENGSFSDIPVIQENSDYQEYLASLEDEANTL